MQLVQVSCKSLSSAEGFYEALHLCFAHGEVSYSLLPWDQKPDPAGWVSKYKRCLMWGFMLQRSALCWLYSLFCWLYFSSASEYEALEKWASRFYTRWLFFTGWKTKSSFCVQWLFDLRRQKVYVRNAWYHSFGSCQSVCGALSTVLCFTKYCLHFLPSLVCFVKSTPTLLQCAEPGEVHGNRLSLVCTRDAALCALRWKSLEMRINVITVLWRRTQHLHRVLNESMWVQACFL